MGARATTFLIRFCFFLFCFFLFVDVSQVKVPMLVMPSGDDPDHTSVKDVLDKKPFGDKCQYRRFDDMHHGFCAAR